MIKNRFDNSDLWNTIKNPETEVPDLNRLTSIELIAQNYDSQVHEMSEKDTESIILATNCIDAIAVKNGFLPLITDISIISDQRVDGMQGEFGFYHSFSRINTKQPDAVYKAYLDAVYKNHRETNKDSYYESIVTHSQLFKDNYAATTYELQANSLNQTSLPASKDSGYIGGYRFDVEYVAEHKQQVDDNVDEFIEEFYSNLAKVNEKCSTNQAFNTDYLVLIPFRRAKFQPVGELSKITSNTSGSPGGALFCFLRSNKSRDEDRENLKSFIRAVQRAMQISALGEAFGATQERNRLISMSTASYGITHPLAERWGGINGELARLSDNLKNLEDSPELEIIKKRVSSIAVSSTALSSWLELGRILYYAKSYSFQEAKYNGLISNKIFTKSTDLEIFLEIYDRKKLEILVGSHVLEKFTIIPYFKNKLIILHKNASESGKRMIDQVYSQILYEISINAFKYSVPDKDGMRYLYVDIEQIGKKQCIVFTNEPQKEQITRNRHFTSRNKWINYDDRETGGLSIVTALLKWTGSGSIMTKITPNISKFSVSVYLKGLMLDINEE